MKLDLDLKEEFSVLLADRKGNISFWVVTECLIGVEGIRKSDEFEKDVA